MKEPSEPRWERHGPYEFLIGSTPITPFAAPPCRLYQPGCTETPHMERELPYREHYTPGIDPYLASAPSMQRMHERTTGRRS